MLLNINAWKHSWNDGSLASKSCRTLKLQNRNTKVRRNERNMEEVQWNSIHIICIPAFHSHYGNLRWRTCQSFTKYPAIKSIIFLFLLIGCSWLTAALILISVLTGQNNFCSCVVYDTNNSNTCRDASSEKRALPSARAELSTTTTKEKLACTNKHNKPTDSTQAVYLRFE